MAWEEKDTEQAAIENGADGSGGGQLVAAGTDASSQSVQCWTINVHVAGKEIAVVVGAAVQQVEWLANVAVARWDDEKFEGWKRLGVPVSVTWVPDGAEGEEELQMSWLIKDVLHDGASLTVHTSLSPEETAT